MNVYDRYVLPLLIDCCCGFKEICDQRAQLIPKAHGHVLEIGIGTGRNLPFYDQSKLLRLTGLDPAEQMNPKAERRAREAGLEVELLTLSAEAIPAEGASYDTVVCTFTLCTIPDPIKALKEMRRVLKPGGELLFCEHGRSPDENVQRWQDRLTPYWKPIAGGCHMNRDVGRMLSAGGFRPTAFEASYIGSPKPLLWLSRGQAVAA